MDTKRQEYDNSAKTRTVTRSCENSCIQGSNLISPAPHFTMPPRLRHNQITSISSLALLPSPPSPPQCILAQSRHFSATSRSNHLPSQRSVFFSWVNGPGAVFKQAGEEGPKYISAYDKYTWERKELEMDSPALTTPYPLNRSFRSQSVLSNQMREEIYSRVKTQGKSVRQVSAELAVSLERVAAVVRLKAVEKEWVDSVCDFTFLFCFFLSFFVSVLYPCYEEKNQIFMINLEDLKQWLSN